jgi:hypothetical protein
MEAKSINSTNPVSKHWESFIANQRRTWQHADRPLLSGEHVLHLFRSCLGV